MVMKNESSVKKIRILKLWELLRTETDETSPLDTVQIIEKLKQDGLSADRKTLYEDIKLLNEYGFEVMCERSKRNRYYVADRSFDEAEIRMLIDAVFSANFITTRKGEELADKLTRLASKGSYNSLMRNLNDNNDKHDNEQIWYNVDTINTALQEDKKIRFKYFDYDISGNRIYRRKGGFYVANPVGLVFSDGNYYLVAFSDNFKHVANFRIDRMENASLTNLQLSHPEWMNSFDIVKHKNESFSMFTGKSYKVELLADTSLTDVIFDRFGYDIKTNKYGENQFYFKVNVQVSPVFFQWLVTFKDKIKIIYPANVKEEYLKYLNEIINSYND